MPKKSNFVNLPDDATPVVRNGGNQNLENEKSKLQSFFSRSTKVQDVNRCIRDENNNKSYNNNKQHERKLYQQQKQQQQQWPQSTIYEEETPIGNGDRTDNGVVLPVTTMMTSYTKIDSTKRSIISDSERNSEEAYAIQVSQFHDQNVEQMNELNKRLQILCKEMYNVSKSSSDCIVKENKQKLDSVHKAHKNYITEIECRHKEEINTLNDSMSNLYRELSLEKEKNNNLVERISIMNREMETTMKHEREKNIRLSNDFSILKQQANNEIVLEKEKNINLQKQLDLLRKELDETQEKIKKSGVIVNVLSDLQQPFF